MTLRSMTAFARGAGAANGFDWVWEIKTVNGKGLDIRFRLPSGCEALELPAKKVISGRVSRGNVQAALTLDGSALAAVPTVNQSALAAVVDAAKDVASKHGELRPASVGELLALRGVLETTTPSSGATSGSNHDLPEEAILATLTTTLEQLDQGRAQEGQALQAALAGHVEQITSLHKRAWEEPSRTAEALRKRLDDQLARLLDGSGQVSSEIDEARLHQELALLATKADINEELDRLSAHISAARDLLASQEPVGRRLDFLAQEFNRETNTICSKSHSSALTEIGLELKVVIDQFREQALNIE